MKSIQRKLPNYLPSYMQKIRGKELHIAKINSKNIPGDVIDHLQGAGNIIEQYHDDLGGEMFDMRYVKRQATRASQTNETTRERIAELVKAFKGYDYLLIV